MNHCSRPFYFLLLQYLNFQYSEPRSKQFFNSGQRTALSLKLKRLKFKLHGAEGLCFETMLTRLSFVIH